MSYCPDCAVNGIITKLDATAFCTTCQAEMILGSPLEARLAEMLGHVHALQSHDSMDNAWPIVKAVRFAKQAAIDIPILVAALEAVLELHKDEQGSCMSCYRGAGRWVQFPCPTVLAITEALGVAE